MLRIKRVLVHVEEIVSINKMVKEEWFDKEMVRVVLITVNGEEISRVFNMNELEQLLATNTYIKLVAEKY